MVVHQTLIDFMDKLRMKGEYHRQHSFYRRRLFAAYKIAVGIPVFFGIIKCRGIFIWDREKNSGRCSFHVSETENI